MVRIVVRYRPPKNASARQAERAATRSTRARRAVNVCSRRASTQSSASRPDALYRRPDAKTSSPAWSSSGWNRGEDPKRSSRPTNAAVEDCRSPKEAATRGSSAGS